MIFDDIFPFSIMEFTPVLGQIGLSAVTISYVDPPRSTRLNWKAFMGYS
jgi:hypothetical protein